MPEFGTKEQREWFAKYPVLGMLILSLAFNVYQESQKSDLNKSLLAEKDKQIKDAKDAMTDYRNNVLLSNSLNAASATLKK